MKYFLYGKETTKEIVMKYLEILLENGAKDFSMFGLERRFE